MADTEELPPPQAPGKLLPILVITNLLATVGLIAALFLGLVPMGTAEPADDAAAEEVVEEIPPAIYESMDKPIVANFTADRQTRYLQLVVQFMTRSDEVVIEIRNHMPAIIDAIYVLLSQKDFGQLQTLDGREELRQEILGLTQNLLTEETGEPGVEGIYFTTFLVQ